MRLGIEQVSDITGGVLHGRQVEFNGVSTDSRTLKPGNLFVALRGENFNGNEFLYAAQDAGAAAALVEQFDERIHLPQVVVDDACMAMGQLANYWRKKFSGTVIGITGSSGKTSVKGMLHSILAQSHSVHVTPGNLNNHIGVPLTLFGLDKQNHAVVELGTNHPGEIAYLTKIVEPDVALINNIMSAHIEGFGSLAAIAQEKGAIYSCLNDSQTAVINLDDAFARIYVIQTRGSKQMGFTRRATPSEIPTLKAQKIRLSDQGCALFDLEMGDARAEISLRVPGEHCVANALAAASCALAAGASVADIAAGLSAFAGVDGRMQVKNGIAGATIIDDSYNANPGSVKAAIDYLSTCSGETVFVFGDMGELGETTDSAHTEIGAYAQEKNIQKLYCTGTKAALAAQAFAGNSFTFDSQQALADALKSELTPSTTVLVKGSRSSHMERVVKALCESTQEPLC